MLPQPACSNTEHSASVAGTISSVVVVAAGGNVDDAPTASVVATDVVATACVETIVVVGRMSPQTPL